MARRKEFFMKEKLYMIPLNDAVNANDECPFCFVERKIEQDLLDFVLGSGSSYMESDIREQTDKAGFCRTHFKKMFDYGNTLGNGWILKTHYMRIRGEFEKQTKGYAPGKMSFKSKFKKDADSVNPVTAWVRTKEDSCYICNKIDYNMARYYRTFFVMLKDPEFRGRVERCKGFCMGHFAKLLELAEEDLPNGQRQWFYETVLPLMKNQMIQKTIS